MLMATNRWAGVGCAPNGGSMDFKIVFKRLTLVTTLIIIFSFQELSLSFV